MSNAFTISLRPILILCKIIGLINISYYFNSNGLLVKNTDSTYYSFIEFTRTVVLMIFSYIIYENLIFSESMILYKCWVIIITSKISETWIIKYDKYLKLLFCQSLFYSFLNKLYTILTFLCNY